MSLYLPSGERIFGPYFTNPFSETLSKLELFTPGQRAHAFESELAFRVAHEKKSESARFAGALDVSAFPLFHGGEACAVLVYGWVFGHFTDLEECHHIAEVVGANDFSLWRAARSRAPVSPEKLQTYASLLLTLGNTILGHSFAVKKLQEADRVKDELLANVSHELKTPLTSMILRFQTIRLRKYEGEKLTESLKSLERSAMTQLKLIDDLLDAARMLTGKLRLDIDAIDLVDELKEAIETVTPALTAKKITMNLEGFDLRFPTRGDSTRLQQVFWNLIANAVKFTPDGGTVTISIREDGSTCFVRVSDTGVGIDEKFLPFVFDRFSQNEADVGKLNKGLGIGLSIVKHIAELHGGAARVESPGVGKGATFEVALPYPAPELVPEPAV